jgi:hypothetical protein
MRTDDSHIAGLWIEVAKWCILFHGEMQHIFLLPGCCVRVVPYVLAWYGMFGEFKILSRHVEIIRSAEQLPQSKINRIERQDRM